MIQPISRLVTSEMRRGSVVCCVLFPRDSIQPACSKSLPNAIDFWHIELTTGSTFRNEARSAADGLRLE